jgi:general secretion pathway protein I
MTSAPKSQQGFSLLEAIVALTIMATCLLALYGWLSTSTLALGHVRASALALSDARAAMAIVDTVNPMSEPNGKRDLPPLEIRWKARPLTDLRLGMSPAGGATQFDFRLYELDVEVLREGRSIREFNMRKTGWVAARRVAPDDF